MKNLNVRTMTLAVIAFLALCSFKNNPTQRSCKSNCKDGTMEISDTIKSIPYCGQAMGKELAFQGDTLELPYCCSFSGKMTVGENGNAFIKDSATGHTMCNYKIVHLPDSIPFYFRQGVFTKLSLSAKQQAHLDQFKMKVFHQLKDTNFKAQFWFELSGMESAMKNNDVISYVVGYRHLTEMWAKMYPEQGYSKKG